MSVTSLKELQRQSKTMTPREMGGQSVQQFFEGNKKAIDAALPKHMNAERMLKVAMHAIRTTPALLECNTASLMGAVIQCAQLGLEPNTVLGHAYLVPFKNGKKNQKEVQVITGYKGLIDLARRSGQIETFYAHEVCENDEFDFNLGTKPGIHHKPALQNRGDVIAFYACAQMKDGGFQFEIMSREEVERIRDGSQGFQSAIRYKKDHPWISHFVPMGRKTAIRRLAKYLPLSIEFATATTLDGMAEGGQSQGLDDVLTGDYTVVDRSEIPEGDTEPAEPETKAADKAEEPPVDTEMIVQGYLQALNDAASREKLDEIMDFARGELTGSDQGRVTKAYNRNVERLSNDAAEGESWFGGQQ